MKKDMLFVKVMFSLFCIVIIIASWNMIGIFFEKQEYAISTISDTSNSIYINETLEANHSYKVELFFSETTVGTAEVSGNVSFFLNGVLLQNFSYSEIGEVPDDYGDVYAEASIWYWFSPEIQSEFEIIGAIESGERWDYKLYMDLPPHLDTSYDSNALTFVGGVVGVVAMGLTWRFLSAHHRKQ